MYSIVFLVAFLLYFSWKLDQQGKRERRERVERRLRKYGNTRWWQNN